MKKFSKKGNALTSQLTILGLVFIGSAILIAITSLAIKFSNSTQEELISKDLAYTIMTISSSPSDISYRYKVDTSKYKVNIRENKIELNSLRGTETQGFIPVPTIEIQETTLPYLATIPLILRNKKLTFIEENDTQYELTCDKIPTDLQKGDTIAIQNKDSSNDDQIKNLIDLIKTHNKLDHEIYDISYLNPDARISLKIIDEEPGINILYKETNTLNPRKLACNIERYLKQNINQEYPIQIISTTEQRTELTEPDIVLLEIRNRKDFQYQPTEIKDKIAKSIHQAITNSINK